MKQLDLISEEIEEEEQEDDSDEIQNVLSGIWDDIPSSRPEDEEEEEEEEEVDLVGDIEYDEAPEVEEFELTDQAPEQPEVAEKPKKKVFEDPKVIPPTFAVLSPDDIASDASPRQRERIDRLSKLLASHNIDINDYDPNNIMWREWPSDDIREYNNLINYIKFGSHDWSAAGSAQKEVDPYAMAQIRVDLWPDIDFEQTTIRQAIVDILHTGDPNAWAGAERDTNKYNTLKSLYAASRAYYRTHHDKASQLDNAEFLNEYSEHNSVTPTGVPANLGIGLWKVKGTDKYIPVSFKETEQAQEAARKEDRDTITINRADPKTGKTRQIPLERPIAMAEIKGQLSFAPRSNRRVIDNHGWSKAQKVGGLNNAIVNLFSSPKFHPYVMKKNPQLIDWPTIAGLKTPLEFYNRMATGVRGNYLLGWEDDQLLRLLRMFTSALPSTARYDDEMRVHQKELEDTTDEQRRADLTKRIEELQGLIDNPPSPNREEWDKHYVDGKSYPARVASPSEKVDSMTRNIGDLYLYRYIGPNKDLHKTFEVFPREDREGLLDNYKLEGPLRDVVELGVVGELKNIEAMVDKAEEELKRGDNDIVNVDSPAEEIEGEEELEVLEGIVTTPATIIVNGGPFKLHLGDRLIIDNLKK